jgi:GTP-binding protein LepA
MDIRNFCIIAHIDHGKSTLADRLLQAVGAVSPREARDQLLDNMDLERERGITIKASAVTVDYELDNQPFMLNFIDTPGHVDFHYEVSRALTACEGAVLVVDATQGVEAQTVANTYMAVEANLEIITVVNKIDLPTARPDDVAMEIEQILGFPAEECIYVSAKTGQGIDELLANICQKLPPPTGDPEAPAQALIFDSIYDDYRGVIVYFRLFSGELTVGDRIFMMGTGRRFTITELGKFTPKMAANPKDKSIRAGEVGYMVAAIKTLDDVNIGDTITQDIRPAEKALAGYREPQRMVFCDFYPTGDTLFEQLREAIDRLHLNDASFIFSPQSSDALGFGFRCGFLGMLHMDIIQERLEREGNVTLVQTAPTVTYEVGMRDDTVIQITNPADLPDLSIVKDVREPIVRVEIITPNESIGELMKLCGNRRGQYKSQKYLSDSRQILEYELPLAEIIYDFYDKLKSITRGYGTMDYDMIGFRVGNLVKMDILINGMRVDALAIIVHRERAEQRGRLLLSRLKKKIDRHMFEIPLQAALGGKIIARETISAMRKNVTAKCYGGDVTRKRKLLEKQKAGKQRMKRVGTVDIPQEAFMAVLGTDE